MARLAVCTTGGCPTLVQGSGRCAPCRAERERARGSRHERGYGREHEAQRRALLAVHVDGTPCRRCGQPMLRAQQLDAAHSTHLRHDPGSLADHLQHAACNRGDTR